MLVYFIKTSSFPYLSQAKRGELRPGGATLHSIMTPHGPDKNCFESATTEKLKPCRVAEGTQASTTKRKIKENSDDVTNSTLASSDLTFHGGSIFY